MGREKKVQRMKELVAKLGKAAYIYEQENHEQISNYEYDKLYDELLKLEEDTGIILARSVTQKVGYEVVSHLPKIMHGTRMLSLDKTKDVSKLKSFLEENEGLLSWKLDGLTIVCTYENGELIQAVTRGNGEVGEDITNNAKTFKNLPIHIEPKERIVIRGEAIITYSDFNAINALLEEEKYKNPRNLCSGSVRQLNPQITASRNVKLIVFSLVEGKEGYDKKSEELEWLKEQGFEVVEYKKVNKENIEERVSYFAQAIKEVDFASDGLVLTYEDKNYSKLLGTTSKFPKDSIAFKWQDGLKETKIIKIQWNTSRTGLINPIAIFEPVELEGTTVERASVHNLSVLEELKLGEGDRVKVYKANMIIPQIAENLTMSGPTAIPECCPVCGAKTYIKQDKTAKTLYCTNANCKAQRLKAFVHFVGRDAMNIEGLSEATIEKFIEEGFIEDLASLYHLEQYAEQIKAMEGLGEKSYNNLIASVEKSKETTLPQLIYALGILQVGPMNAKLICHYFQNDLEKLMEADFDTLMQIDGIGPIIAKEVVDYFSLEQNKRMLEHLIKEVHFKKIQEVEAKDSPIKDKNFVVTGEVVAFKNRKELQAKIEALGGKVTSAVSKSTNYLINNDLESASSKNKKAKELNIPILNEEAFLELIVKGQLIPE